MQMAYLLQAEHVRHEWRWRHPETSRISMAAATVTGCNGGHIKVTFRAQRRLDFSIAGKLPDQTKSTAFFGEQVAQFRSEQHAGVDRQSVDGAPGAVAIGYRRQAVPWASISR